MQFNCNYRCSQCDGIFAELKSVSYCRHCYDYAISRQYDIAVAKEIGKVIKFTFKLFMFFAIAYGAYKLCFVFN